MKTPTWIVKPETTAPIELTLVDGDGDTHEFWIKLKRRLTIGEKRQIQNAGWSGFRPPSSGEKAEISVNWKEQAFTRLVVWLVEWSLEDENRRRLPVTRDVVESLDPVVFDAIETAIMRHERELDEEKKVTTGASEPPATSS